MRGRELGDKPTQLGFRRSSRHRRLGTAGDLDFNLDGTTSGGFFLHAHDGSFLLYGLASRKSFTIGTMMGKRCISVTWVVLGKMANRDAERGCRSP